MRGRRPAIGPRPLAVGRMVEQKPLGGRDVAPRGAGVPVSRVTLVGLHGQILLVVLWVMGCVSLATGALAVRSTHALRLERIPLESLQRKAIAEAGLRQALGILAQDTTERPLLDTLQESWATGLGEDDTPLCERMPVGAGPFSLGQWDDALFLPGLIDEERKMNLNTAPPEQLQQLMELVASGDADPALVAQAIADWRDEPEGSACQGASPPCHHGPFDSVDELRLVPDLTPELFAALQPYVTVYGSGAVNVNTASEAVLSAMGCDAAAILQQRQDEPFTEPPPGCGNAAVASTAFTVNVEAELSGASNVRHARAVVDRSGRVLSWSPR